MYGTAKRQLDEKEGCQIEGNVMLHKVPGNFHLSSHDAPESAMKLMQNGYKINFTHKINHLSFGDKKEMATINYKYGGEILNELNGKDYKQQIPFGQLMMNYNLYNHYRDKESDLDLDSD